MSRLTALVPAAVCAAALGRAWPEDLDGQVRCIDEGTRALGLAWCCSPQTHEAQHPDDVTAGLVGTPGALPVLGVVDGPVSASLGTGHVDGSAHDVQDRLDDASDWAVDRIRALSECGVRRAAVVEGAAGPLVCDHTAVESHRPLLTAAAHLRMELVLVAGDLDDAGSFGYESFVSRRGCSQGLGLLAEEAFDSPAELELCLDRHRAGTVPEEVITAPLDDRVSPDLLRRASGVLSGEVARP